MYHRNTLWRVIIAAILIGVFIFLGRTAAGEVLRGGIISLVSPLMRMSAGVRSFVGFGNERISEEMAKDLIRENQELIAERFKAEILQKENQELRDAFQFKKETGIDLLSTNVVLFTNELGREALVTEGGKEIGIRDGDMAIIGDRILVGIVREAGNGFSKIEIASNPMLTHEVSLLPLGVPAIAKGLGGRTFSLEFIPQDAAIDKGDLVAVFVPELGLHLFLAKVTYEKIPSASVFQEARAVLIARPELLETVFILRRR